jgi:predicted phosphoribosyltransferase
MLAVRMARRRKASRVIVAAPVISKEAEETLKKEADKVVALEFPYKFRALGDYYEDF